MTEPLVDLQTAHMTQYTNDGVKGDWHVRKNITSDDMFTMPKCLGDKDAWSIFENAKKYELLALNAGINFQKGKQNAVLVERIAQLEKITKALSAENERLATVLERHIISKEN